MKTALLYTTVANLQDWQALTNSRQLDRWFVDSECKLAATEPMADAAENDIYTEAGWNEEPPRYPALVHIELNNEQQIEIAEAIRSGQIITDLYDVCPNCNISSPINEAEEGDCRECDVHLYRIPASHQHISTMDAVKCDSCNPQGLTLREYQSAIELGNDPKAATVRCLYCGADIDAELAYVVPTISDEEAWADAAKMHMAGCEWVATRAHNLR